MAWINVGASTLVILMLLWQRRLLKRYVTRVEAVQDEIAALRRMLK